MADLTILDNSHILHKFRMKWLKSKLRGLSGTGRSDSNHNSMN